MSSTAARCTTVEQAPCTISGPSDPDQRRCVAARAQRRRRVTPRIPRDRSSRVFLCVRRYLISCASSSVSMAASVGPPIIIPFMLFGGFFLNSGSVPPYLGWISYLSWFRYGNEALLINQWSGVERIACTRNNSTCPASGQVVLDTLSFSQDDFTMDVVNMVLLFIGFRLLAFFALLLRTRRAK